MSKSPPYEAMLVEGRADDFDVGEWSALDDNMIKGLHAKFFAARGHLNETKVCNEVLCGLHRHLHLTTHHARRICAHCAR